MALLLLDSARLTDLEEPRAKFTEVSIPPVRPSPNMLILCIRPYKTYLITPIIFCCVALFLLYMPLFSAPLEALAAFGFISLGYPVYLLTQTRRPEQSYGIMAFGEQPKPVPLTRTEKAVEAIRNLPDRILQLFGKRSQSNDDAGQYEAVELDDEAGGGDLSRTQSRQAG
jgi:hypothetical protein